MKSLKHQKNTGGETEDERKVKQLTFLMLKVRGETFRLDVFCLIFSRCSTDTNLVPILVIFFSMFCLENAFFKLSTCTETQWQVTTDGHSVSWTFLSLSHLLQAGPFQFLCSCLLHVLQVQRPQLLLLLWFCLKTHVFIRRQVNGS